MEVSEAGSTLAFVHYKAAQAIISSTRRYDGQTPVSVLSLYQLTGAKPKWSVATYPLPSQGHTQKGVIPTHPLWVYQLLPKRVNLPLKG